MLFFFRGREGSFTKPKFIFFEHNLKCLKMRFFVMPKQKIHYINQVKSRKMYNNTKETRYKFQIQSNWNSSNCIHMSEMKDRKQKNNNQEPRRKFLSKNQIDLYSGAYVSTHLNVSAVYANHRMWEATTITFFEPNISFFIFFFSTGGAAFSFSFSLLLQYLWLHVMVLFWF